MDKDLSIGNRVEMLTVAQLVDSFLAHHRVLASTGQGSPSTEGWYRSHLAHLVRACGELPSPAVRQHNLVGITCTNGFVRCLKALYKWAVDEELLAKDPFRKLKTPPCGERNRVLERGELARLYRACRRPFRQMLFIQAHTIARPGEVRKLRWRDVRLTDRLIVLNEFKGKNRRADGVKVRIIPLDPLVVRMLTTWFRRRQPRPEDFLFVSPRTGKPFSGNALRCRMRRARTRAGLDPEGGGERVVCYTLRHTGATEATRAGLGDRLLADIMGHSSTNMVKRYQHLNSADKLKGIDKLIEAQNSARKTRTAHPA